MPGDADFIQTVGVEDEYVFYGDRDRHKDLSSQ